MERRRLIEEPEQQELPLPVPRRRVALDDEPSPSPELGAALSTLLAEDTTEWEGKLAPPCSGFWEVKQKSARSGSALRFWYGPINDAWMWWNPNPYRTSEEGRGHKLTHEVFMQSHEWRGLKNRPADYDYLLKYPGEQATPAPTARRHVDV